MRGRCVFCSLQPAAAGAAEHKTVVVSYYRAPLGELCAAQVQHRFGYRAGQGGVGRAGVAMS